MIIGRDGRHLPATRLFEIENTHNLSRKYGGTDGSL